MLKARSLALFDNNMSYRCCCSFAAAGYSCDVFVTAIAALVVSVVVGVFLVLF